MLQNINVIAEKFYTYTDINQYIVEDVNTEDIISIYCANTGKLYSKEVKLDIETDLVIVHYIIFVL